VDVVTVDYDRGVHAPTETSRRTVLEALRQMSFKIDQSQGAVIQAHRGSFAGAKFGADGRIRASVTVTADAAGDSRVHVRLGDNEQLSLDSDEACRLYGPLFMRIEADLDHWLCALDPQLTPGTRAPLEIHPDHRVTFKEHLGGLARHLPGPMGRSAAKAMLGDLYLWVIAPDASGVLSPDDAQTCLAVAAIVSADQQALPPSLRRQIGDLTVALRDALTDSRPPAGRLDIPARDKRAVDFLFQQVRIRESLPVREVHTCRDCGAERVVNPDYQKRLATNKALQHATGLMGVTIGSGGVNPFIVVGKLLNLDALAPSTPCRRCEGTDTDVSLATLCPKCHAIRREPVLTTCPDKACGYDFRTRAAGVSLWQSQPLVTGIEPTIAVAASGARWAPPSAPAVVTPPGWYPDPYGRHQQRWFEGSWTSWVADAGVTVADPVDGAS
jgi:hypothetical protein